MRLTQTGLKKILVTGGAGFIGASLIPALLDKRFKVIVMDNLSNGKKLKLESFLSWDNFQFIQSDLLDETKLKEVVENCDLIFHLAANVEVRKGSFDTEIDFLNNTVATRNLIEAMRTSNRCKKIVFTSSSVVYGDSVTLPTPEDYGPLKPISLYGATKLACESLICGYAGMFDIKAVIFRLANVIGPESEHGVIFDFFRKLGQSHGDYLEILGDGTQKKSYLYIDDCIDALVIGLKQFESDVEIFNLGSDDQVDTNSIARIIISQLNVRPKIKYVSEQKDGRGWPGDIKNMLLSTEKLKKVGWKINYSSEESVLLTVKKIIEYGYNMQRMI